MSKYIIWTSATTGEYKKAHKVLDTIDTVVFIQVLGIGTEKIVGTYKKKDIIEYHEVK